MRIQIEIDDEARKHVEQMASESGFSVSDLVEIAIFNFVALWLRDKHPQQSLVADDGVDGSNKLDSVTGDAQ